MLGRALTILSNGQSSVFDLANVVEVELDDADHWLQSRDDDALINGANLAVLGDEVVQFGAAEPTGLSGLDCRASCAGGAAPNGRCRCTRPANGFAF